MNRRGSNITTDRNSNNLGAEQTSKIISNRGSKMSMSGSGSIAHSPNMPSQSLSIRKRSLKKKATEPMSVSNPSPLSTIVGGGKV